MYVSTEVLPPKQTSNSVKVGRNKTKIANIMLLVLQKNWGRNVSTMTEAHLMRIFGFLKLGAGHDNDHGCA